MAARERPIGWWLKHLDGLIEAAFDRALATERLSRRHWQTLNVLARSPLDEAGLAAELRPFWGDGEITLDQAAGELAGRGWLARNGDGRWVLTDTGLAAHAGLAEKVGLTRRRMAEGVSGPEYETTVAVLRRMAANLEGGPPA
jgi:hypothetical protein